MARPLYKHRIFKDRAGKWRWTLFARNGRKVACCGEGYNRKGHAEAMVVKLFGAALLFLLLVTVGCAVPPAPVVSPQPAPAQNVRVAVTVLDASRQAVPGLQCELVPDDSTAIPCDYSSGIQAVYQVPANRIGWGADLTLSADGFTTYRGRVVVAADLPEVTLGRKPTLSALRLSGRHGLVNEAGAKVPWTAVTGFRLVELVAHGRSAEAGVFLESIKPARGVRVLLMARNLFQLSPDEGLGALPATFELAAQHGVYLETTIFADTNSFPLSDADYRRIADQFGSICASHRAACALAEVANEVWPLHETQSAGLADLAFLRSLKDTIQTRSNVPVSLGSTHADQDESDRMRDGDYLTIHGNRAAGDDGDWRWVRHSNEQRALADGVGRYAVNDEPRRDDLACDKQIGMALLTRLFSLGDTFHFAGGLQARPPSGSEAQAFACRARGWAAVPDDWQGSYFNAGFAGGPVKSFDGAVRVYSSVNGGLAYTLVLGAMGGLRIDWADGWRPEPILSDGGARLYRVSR